MNIKNKEKRKKTGKGRETAVNKIIEKNLPKLQKRCLSKYKIYMQIQIDWSRKDTPSISFEALNIQNREKLLKSSIGKRPDNIKADFLK